MSDFRHMTDRTGAVQRMATDRRRGADRRATWRGGRRDVDWISRPREPAQIERGEHWLWTLVKSTRHLGRRSA